MFFFFLILKAEIDYLLKKKSCSFFFFPQEICGLFSHFIKLIFLLHLDISYILHILLLFLKLRFLLKIEHCFRDIKLC